MSGIYDRARYDLLTGALPWLTTDFVLSAFGGVPAFDPAHGSMADIIAIAGNPLGVSLAITGNGATLDGAAQTDPVIIPAVPIGPNVTWLVLANGPSTVPILFIDDAVELPFVPNGLDMVVSPDWAQQRGWFRP